MAIKVSGTTVINDSRQLQNVASLDATTTATISAVAGGGISILDGWDPTATPDVTFTSSGTWSKPSDIEDGTWVVFYMVGGGAGGVANYENATNGAAGAATFVTGLIEDLPSSVTVTIGAGGTGRSNSGAAASGGNTTLSANSKTYTAMGGATYTAAVGAVFWAPLTNPFAQYLPTVTNTTSGDLGTNQGGRSPGADSTYAGAEGAGPQWSNNYGTQLGGVSTYAGNGGNSPYNATGGNGLAPGGAGGNTYNGRGYAGGNGGNGSVRVYYLD